MMIIRMPIDRFLNTRQPPVFFRNTMPVPGLSRVSSLGGGVFGLFNGMECDKLGKIRLSLDNPGLWQNRYWW
jgi:hypothetical protein